MNATQALTRLRKVLGKNAAAQDSRRPSSPELREVAQIARRAASERRKAAEAAMMRNARARCGSVIRAIYSVAGCLH